MAVGDFTPLVLKPELDAAKARITQAETDVDTLDTQLNNPTTGVVKQLVDIDTEINAAGTGIKAQIADLKSGGTSTTKFRTHSDTGKYADGEIVQRNGLIYKANSAIDGSATAVPFVEGSAANTWTQLGADPVKDWDVTSAYRIDQVVRHLGGMWAANSAIAKNTAFSQAVSGANTWRPLIGGVWNTNTSLRMVESTATLNTFVWDVQNKVDLGSNTLTAKIGNHDKLTLTNTSSAFRSGSATNSEFLMTGDTAVDLKLNGIKKMAITSGGSSTFRADDNNYAESHVNGTYLLKVRGFDVLQAGGTGNEYIYLRSPSATSNQGRLNMGPNVIQGQLGNTDKLLIDASQFNTYFNTNNYTSLQSGRYLLTVGGINMVDLASSSYAKYGWNSSNCLNATSTLVSMTYVGVDRLYCNSTESRIRSPNSDSDVTASNGSVSIKAGSASGTISFTVNSNERLSIGSVITVRAGFVPSTTNVYDLGSSSLRWATIYAQNALNTASDKTLKENIKDIPDVLLDAWGEHVSPKQYGWVDKTTSDKTHIGFIAQDIIAAFEKAGLDWKQYGIISGDGVEVKFGVSYTDAHVIETAYQRRRLAKLEALIEAMK